MKIYIASVLLLPAVAGFQLAPTRVTRAVHIPRAADASYAEAIEQDRVTLRRAAATKNEESDAVVDALLGLEQSCKERSRAEGASAGAAIADKLTGAWRLVFTTGTISRQKRTGARVNYFPVKGVQTFDLPASKITNGIFFGDGRPCASSAHPVEITLCPTPRRDASPWPPSMAIA